MLSFKSLLLLCFVSFGYSAYTHGIAGSFRSVGLVNWRGWGYWSKTNQRWVPLKAPVGPNIATSQIAGTSDGGAIIVGEFSSVNGRQAASVAYYDVAKDDWFPANEVGLYKVSGGPGDSTGTCRAGQGSGVDFLARNGQVAEKPLAIGNTLTNPGNIPEAITVPVQANPLTGQSDVVSSTNPVRQFQQPWHTQVGVGRAIIADRTTADRFYVFGNFENVGLDVDAAHNRELTAAGWVQFDYNPQTKRITPSIIGTAGYKTRTRADVQDTLHPRNCGHSGSATCHPTNDGTTTFGCASESPHNNDDAVQAGMTSGASGMHFFVQEANRDIYRWTPGSGKWVNVVVNDGQFNAQTAGRAGTGQDIALLAPNAMTNNPAAQVNIRVSTATLISGRSTTASPNDFKWMVSEDQTTLWIFRGCYPNVTAFTGSSGYVSGDFMFGWDDALTNKGYFGGMRSTNEQANVFTSAFTDANFPTDKFRSYDAVIPTPPATSPVSPPRTSEGIKTTGCLALTSQSALTLNDERIPGTPTFQANRYANTNFLNLNQVTAAGTAATPVGQAAAGPRFTTSARPTNPVDDNNGNQKMPWAYAYNTISNLWRDAEQTIYARASSGEIMYDPILHSAPGHTDNTYGYRFKKTFGGQWMSYTSGGNWVRPFGGGIDATPIKFWQKTIGTESRVYMLTGGATKAWNFPAQSGVALYDKNTHKWVDPFGDWRLVNQEANWYDRATGSGSTWAEVGDRGTANVVHFQPKAGGGEEIIVAGSFSYLQDAHYPSIVAWDATTPGAGFRRVGSATTGLYLQATSTMNKRWIEEFAPSDTNPKVGQGTVNCITHNGARMFVGGTFDRSTNAVTSDNFLRNVATISSYADATATFQDVDGGCNGQVNQLIVFKDELYAAGDFDHCGQWGNGGNKRSIARISADVTLTSKWHSLGTGIQGDVRALVEWNGELIVAGDFTSVASSGFGTVASWSGTAWSYLKTSCNDICQSKKLSLAAASFNGRSFLGSMLRDTVYSLVATDRLWAVVDSNNVDEAGNTLSEQEVAYYDGSGWWRVARAGVEQETSDTYNGFLAVNGTSGQVIIANAQFTSGGMNNWQQSGGDGNTINIDPASIGQPHTFPVWPGIQHASGRITHFAAASTVTVSVAVIAVASLMLFL